MAKSAPASLSGIADQVAITELLSLSWHTAALSNLALRNALENSNLVMKNAISNQHSLNLIGAAVTSAAADNLLGFGPLAARLADGTLSDAALAAVMAEIEVIVEAFRHDPPPVLRDSPLLQRDFGRLIEQIHTIRRRLRREALVEEIEDELLEEEALEDEAL